MHKHTVNVLYRLTGIVSYRLTYVLNKFTDAGTCNIFHRLTDIICCTVLQAMCCMDFQVMYCTD